MRGGRLRRSAVQRLVAAGLVAVVLALFTGVGRTQLWFEGFRNQAGDQLFPRGDTDPRITVVGVDRESLRAYPDFPWPRELQAQLVERLFEAGAAVVAFDFTYDSSRPGDDVLAAAVQGRKVVLGAGADLDLPRGAGAPRRVQDRSLTMPTDVLLDSGAGVGLVNVLPDPADGVVRSIPLIADADVADLPSLSLAAVQALEGTAHQPVTRRPFGIQAGARLIPTEDQHTLRVSFSPELHPGSGAAYVSAVDALQGRLDRGALEGDVVFVGATAVDLGDYRPTPVGKDNLGVPGVYIHANAANTMLTEAYVTLASRREAIVWVLVLSLLVLLLALFAPLRVSLPATFVIGVGYFLLSTARSDAGVVADLVYPNIALVLSLIGGFGLRYLLEGRQRRRVSALFSQYVPPAVAQRLVDEDRVESAMEGERVEISVLFCDLRGFTAQSAKMEPTQVREMLEEYYLVLGKLILEHEGTLMQYVGDEIFAIFGAPLPVEDHCEKALRCAMAMQEMRPQIGETLAARGLPPIFYGIGLNTGNVVAAHVGGVHRQYAVIGDTVNIGARLCGQAREDQICFPESFRERCTTQPELDDLGPIEFKNATRPIQVWRYWAHRDADTEREPAVAGT